MRRWRVGTAVVVGVVGVTLTVGLPPAGAQPRSLTEVDVSSAGVRGNGNTALGDYPAVSADGRYVAFSSFATNLVAGVRSRWSNVYLRDLLTGATRLVSATPAGGPGNGNSRHPSISANGRYLAFDSYAANLVAGDGNRTGDIFVADLVTGRLRLVSRAVGGGPANGASDEPSLSADGRLVAYDSYASNLVAGDGNRACDVFVTDLTTGTTRLASVASDGAQGRGPSGQPNVTPYGKLGSGPSISGDGRSVVFWSHADNLDRATPTGTPASSCTG